MPKKYINGSQQFDICLIDANGATEYLNFSFDYTALYEFDRDIAIRRKYIDGSKSKQVFEVEMEWLLDYSTYFKQEDALKIQKVKQAEFQGKQIILIPHTDTPWRAFKVQIISDKRKLGQYASWDFSEVNKDYVIMFENVEPITAYNWIDPDAQPVYSDEQILVIN